MTRADRHEFAHLPVLGGKVDSEDFPCADKFISRLISLGFREKTRWDLPGNQASEGAQDLLNLCFTFLERTGNFIATQLWCVP
jgi:hypothetical protein